MPRWLRGTAGLVAMVVLGISLATLAIGFIAYEVSHEALERQLDHRISTETAALLHESSERPEAVASAIARRELGRNTSSLEYNLLDPEGRSIAGSFDAQIPTSPGYTELLPYKQDGGTGIAQALITDLPGGYRLTVAADRSAIDDMDRTLLKLFASTFGAMLAIGAFAAWIVGAATRRRLDRIDRTALAIIEGDLSRRVPMAGIDDEFDGLAHTLNRMLDRMAGLMDNLRQVSSDVAHDLRTPLTRLHGRLDEALSSHDPSVQRKAIEAAQIQSSELLEIFAALLRISEIEAGADIDRKPVPLDDLVTELAETYQPAFAESGHRLETLIEQDITLDGDRRLLQQLFTNLLDNALRHTPTGTLVTVSLSRDNDKIRLTVADNGPGVTAESAGRLFQRFVRAEASRSGSGHGLGLAMVSAIAAAHDGEAAIQLDCGFTLNIFFPARKIHW